MSVKKMVFILITASFTVILLLIFRYVPANSVPYIKDYIPIVYTSNEETMQEEKNTEPVEPKIIMKESSSVSGNEINYTASQYHNFEKIIDELIMETKDN